MMKLESYTSSKKESENKRITCHETYPLSSAEITIFSPEITKVKDFTRETLFMRACLGLIIWDWQ